jgi:hypothetical protein
MLYLVVQKALVAQTVHVRLMRLHGRQNVICCIKSFRKSLLLHVQRLSVNTPDASSCAHSGDEVTAQREHKVHQSPAQVQAKRNQHPVATNTCIFFEEYLRFEQMARIADFEQNGPNALIRLHD